MSAPEKPDLPIDTRTFGEWFHHYAVPLMTWYKACHGHDDPSPNEWSEYGLRMFHAQIEVEETMIFNERG